MSTPLNPIIGEDLGVTDDLRPRYKLPSQIALLAAVTAPYVHYEGEEHYIDRGDTSPLAGKEVRLLALSQCQNTDGSPATQLTWGTLLPHWQITGQGPSLPLDSVQFNNNGVFGGSQTFTFRNPGLLSLGTVMPNTTTTNKMSALALATVITPFAGSSNLKAALSFRNEFGILLQSYHTGGFRQLNTVGFGTSGNWSVNGATGTIQLSGGVLPRVNLFSPGLGLVGSSFPAPVGTPSITQVYELPIFSQLTEEAIYDATLSCYARYSISNNQQLDAYLIQRLRVLYYVKNGVIQPGYTITSLDRAELGNTQNGNFTVTTNSQGKVTVNLVRPRGAGVGYDGFNFVRPTILLDIVIAPVSEKFVSLENYFVGN